MATFRVGDQEFNVWFTNTDTINALYDLNSRQVTGLIPYGPVMYGAGEFNHNLPYQWHLDPERTQLLPSADKACNAALVDVGNHLDQFVHEIGNYCPAGAVLIKLLDYRIPLPGIETG